MDITNKKRCNWSKNNTLYIEYHDKEWGVPWLYVIPSCSMY